ncbi:hypothetical protein L7F22_048143 [Adiantum nelumboides]|nr:hypothetical protein [Adiantum nelumboides]
MALVVAKNRTIRCDYGSFILENLVEANLKGSAKNKLYMSAGPMPTKIAYQALGMIEDLPVANSQAALIQNVRLVARFVRTTTTTTSSRATRSTKTKSSSDEEKMETDEDEDTQRDSQEKVLLEFEKDDEEDSSTPLDRKGKEKIRESALPRSETQIAYAKAQRKVEERKKKLVDVRAAKKAASTTVPQTMEQARQARLEKAKELQAKKKKNRRRAKGQGGGSHLSIIRGTQEKGDDSTNSNQCSRDPFTFATATHARDTRPAGHFISGEEGQGPAPGALDVRAELSQSIEDMQEGPSNEFMIYEAKVLKSIALAYLQPNVQVKDVGHDFLPLPLMRHEANLWKDKVRPSLPRNEDGGYEGIPLTTEEAQALAEDHPKKSPCTSLSFRIGIAPADGVLSPHLNGKQRGVHHLQRPSTFELDEEGNGNL